MSVTERVQKAVRKGQSDPAIRKAPVRHQEFVREMERQGVLRPKRYNIVQPSATDREEATKARFLIG